jgi:AraC family transcriptional regulator
MLLNWLYEQKEGAFLAKIAVGLGRPSAHRSASGGTSRLSPRLLAHGSGWTVRDVICTAGPQDPSYEEQHSHTSIAIVAAGSFQYRSGSRSGKQCELMTPGSLLLGNAGQIFECGHEHGKGDRCLSFQYTQEYFERLAADAGATGSRRRFYVLRLPPLRALSPVIARACAGVAGPLNAPWEELSIQLAVQAVQLVSGLTPHRRRTQPGIETRVARTVRAIEHRPDAVLTLENMAREVGLSPYHFLRTFQLLTGGTPHQFILRARLRHAATRLLNPIADRSASILDIALDCGFGDLSNFNHAFRAEFGLSPHRYRKLHT